MFRRPGFGAIAITGFVLLSVALIVPRQMSAKPSPKKVKAVVGQEGQIQVIDEAGGQVVHQFRKPAGVVREIFALGDGSRVAVSQKNSTEFYDAATGKRVRRIEERTYAFSHDQTVSVVFTAGNDLLLYNYPQLSVKFTLAENQGNGPSAVLFSPDDRYLAVQFCSRYPLSDEEYPNPVLEKTFFTVVLFDLMRGERLAADGGVYVGRFSDDSRVYTTGEGASIELGSRRP